jgi:NADH-quinone oxidoreductase subunit L
MLALTVFLTACYMFRVAFVVFFASGRPAGHPHDPPAVMAVPLWTLAVLTLVTGLLFAFGVGEAPAHGPGWIPALSLALGLAGIVVAWLTWERRLVSAESLARGLGPLAAAARRKFWLDDLYAGIYRGIILALSWLVGWVDRYLVDGLVNVASAWTLRWGDRLRRIQTGLVQDYLYGVAFGLLLVVVWSYWR